MIIEFDSLIARATSMDVHICKAVNLEDVDIKYACDVDITRSVIFELEG